MDFADIASRYAQTRWDQATQPFTDPEAYLNRRLGIDNTTEEGNVKPVTQTIKTNPQTGEQEMTIKGTPQDLSAANPLTPTVTMPGQAQPTFNFNQPAPIQQAPAQPIQPSGMMPTGGVVSAIPRAPMPDTSNVLPGQQIPPGQIPQPIMDDTGRIVGYETPDQTMAALRNRTPFVPTPPVQQPVQQAPVQAPTPPVQQPVQQAPAPAAVAPVAPTPVQAPAPAVVPTQAPAQAPSPVTQERQLEQWQQDLIDAQKDPTKLHAYIANEKNPAEGRTMAETLLKNQYKRQEEEARTDKLVKDFVGGDRKAQTDVMKRLSSKSEEGSLFKAYLYNRFGLHELAKQEQQKLGGTSFERMMVNGQNYLVEINPQGGITGAFDAKGKAVGEDVLTQLNAGASKFGTHAYGFTGGSITIPTGHPDAGQEYRQRTNSQTGQIENIITTGPNAGKIYTGPAGYEKRVTTQAMIGSNQLIFDLQKKHGGNVLDALKEFQDIKGPLNPDDRSAFLERYGYGTTIPNKVQIPGQPVPTAPIAPEPVTPAPVVRQPTSYTPEPTGGMMTTGYTPGQEPGGFIKTGGADIGTPIGTLRQQQELGTAAGKAKIDIGKKSAEELNTANRTYSDELAKSRQSAISQRSTIDRLQTAINKNPSFWGIDTNSALWRAYVDINSTNENKAEALNTLARNLNIPADKRSEFDQVMNDYRNLQVNAITGSGLTASQTNTERESQRVLGTIGSISDRPAAARATLEYAKAKIEYTEAKAKAWAQARKANPNLDRLEFEVDFDETKGEQIFKDANDRMNKILGVSASPAAGGLKEGQTSVSKSGKPIVVRNGKWEYQ
jgi:hypothetical protein